MTDLAPDSRKIMQSLEAFCAYQERSPDQVKQKLIRLGVATEAIPRYLEDLRMSGFLNDERFARLFVRGKFNGRKWGRLKILNQLRAKGIPPNIIWSALDEISDTDYQEALSELFAKKWKETKGSNHWDKRAKVMRFLQQKGYESELILKEINRESQEE